MTAVWNVASELDHGLLRTFIYDPCVFTGSCSVVVRASLLDTAPRLVRCASMILGNATWVIT